MAETFEWRCPFCDRDTIINPDYSAARGSLQLTIPNSEGMRGAVVTFVVCPNRECRRFTLDVGLNELKARMAVQYDGRQGKQVPIRVGWDIGDLMRKWTLVPPSRARVFPPYIPPAIREDYEEACSVCNASPKAAATLARRALQGMIRDFWDVKLKSGKLSDEIDELKGKVDSEVWDAMQAVRKVGNMGAHMEQDVNLIIAVEPQEAERLIALIELLMKEWYINREARRAALRDVKALAESKEAAKKPPKG
jgi:hypothetical protein